MLNLPMKCSYTSLTSSPAHSCSQLTLLNSDLKVCMLISFNFRILVSTVWFVSLYTYKSVVTKTGKWSDTSVIIIPGVWYDFEFVKILLIRVAEFAVILVGFVILG